MLAAKKALLTGREVDKKLFEQKLLIVRLLQEKGIFGKPKIKAILTFLQNYILFNDSKLNRIFIEQVDTITDKKYTMGIIEQVAEMREAEGIKKGGKMTTRLIVENLLKDPAFSMQKIATVTNVSLDFVKKVKKELSSK